MNKNESINDVMGYWGKARPIEEGVQFHSLLHHSLDVAAVGKIYLEASPALTAWLCQQTRIHDPQDLVAWLTFWLAIHDLGKFSFSFQGQRLDLVQALQAEFPVGMPLTGERHDTLGFALWCNEVETLIQNQSWFGGNEELLDGLQCWAQAVTGHHGQPPSNGTVKHLLTSRSSSGPSHFRDQDKAAALVFVQLMRDQFLGSSLCQSIAAQNFNDFLQASQKVSWWIAGIAVLADWIGSNAQVFNYQGHATTGVAEYWAEAQVKATKALAKAGVLPPSRQDTQAFDELFPSIKHPSPLQHWSYTQTLTQGPQLHILEDMTGAGKTEAAMMLTHRLMANGSADGFYIGLPTMATANAMYGRLTVFYRRLFASEHPSLVLAHGQRKLVEAFAQSIIDAGPAEGDNRQGDESATQRCVSWLADHNKRSLLCPAGVGTIDQALMAVLQGKHQSLRLLGLVRKVLVVDEVHACDPYMQRILETLLEFHARAGGSAILMSATLPSRMKTALLNAFARGCQSIAPGPSSAAYPLATTWAMAQPGLLNEQPLATRVDVQRRLCLRYVSKHSTLISDIVQALEKGHCVAWIRNTVSDALDAVKELSQHVPPECITLFHARFALGDRLDTEDRVLKIFGRDSTPETRRGQLLIATQVAEQSLDIDTDWLVTDLAPIDRIIQRAGRLRRHVRNAAGALLTHAAAKDERGEPCLWIYGPEWHEQADATWFKTTLPKAAYVYPNHGQIWLTAKALQAPHITLPDEGRQLIESVFDQDPALPPGLVASSVQAEGKSFSETSHAQMNSVKFSSGYSRTTLDWTADSVAPSRLGEETVEVLLGVWEGDVLQPLRRDKGVHAWSYSTLRVARRLITEACPEATPERQAALDAVKATLAGGGKWVILLAMQATADGFAGTALASPLNGRTPTKQTRHWHYSQAMGLTAPTSPPG